MRAQFHDAELMTANEYDAAKKLVRSAVKDVAARQIWTLEANKYKSIEIFELRGVA